MILVSARSYKKLVFIGGNGEVNEGKLEEQMYYQCMDITPVLHNLPLLNSCASIIFHLLPHHSTTLKT
jgi:hypothetical protein